LPSCISPVEHAQLIDCTSTGQWSQMLIPFGLRGALLGFSQRRINLPSIAKNIRVIRVICVRQKQHFQEYAK